MESFFHSIATHIRFSEQHSILYLKRKTNSTKQSNNMDVKRRSEKAIEIATTIVKAGAVERWNLAFRIPYWRGVRRGAVDVEGMESRI